MIFENQENKSVYNLLGNFFFLLKDNDWLINFIFWELNFYKSIGYDIDFKNYVKNVNINGDDKFIVESTRKIIPNFIINNNVTNNNNEIISGFKVVGEFLDKSILKPNNISFPLSRIELEKLIKQI